MNLVTPKARATNEHLFNKPASVCRTSKSDLSSKTKCDQKHISCICKLVTPKAGAKKELLFNKPVSASPSISDLTKTLFSLNTLA